MSQNVLPGKKLDRKINFFFFFNVLTRQWQNKFPKVIQTENPVDPDWPLPRTCCSCPRWTLPAYHLAWLCFTLCLLLDPTVVPDPIPQPWLTTQRTEGKRIWQLLNPCRVTNRTLRCMGRGHICELSCTIQWWETESTNSLRGIHPELAPLVFLVLQGPL